MNYMVDGKTAAAWASTSVPHEADPSSWMQQGHSINELVTSTSYAMSKFRLQRLLLHRSSMGVQNSAAVPPHPETPLQGAIKPHNTTQASACVPSRTPPNRWVVTQPQTPPTSIRRIRSSRRAIGTVQASPLTMANVYATLGANGVECTPLPSPGDRRSAPTRNLPSANYHQAIPSSEIAQTTTPP